MTDLSVTLLRKGAFLRKPARYKVLHGGRGGGKSYVIAQELLLQAARAKHRVLCTREFQSSIKDSVHRLLKEQIEAMGLGGFYDVQNVRILGRNGSEFIFAGIHHNVSNIKSMYGITRAWVEEAEAVSEDSWAVLIPTVREAGSEIWVSFNPDLESDATYKRFITDPPPGSVVREVNWRDNPWLSDELRREKDYLYSADADAAAHVWGGKTRQLSKALVLFGKVAVEPFEPGDDWDGPYQGVDWGFAESPLVLVRLWIHGTELYLEREAYGVGVEITDTPGFFDQVEPAESARTYVTRADNARPEMIAHCRNHDYPRMIACSKGKGSVEDGVAHLRGYTRIVIHPRCKNAIAQARTWSYKKTKGGDVLPVLVDANDDIWDAARYALEPIMKQDSIDHTVIVI